MHIDDIAFLLWHDCIRPAARYDQWVPAPQHADGDGYTEVVTTPVLDVAGHKCVLSYWRDDLGTEVWCVALSPEPGVRQDVARIYTFGDAWPEAPPGEDVIFEWDLHGAPSTAILACPVYLPEQLEMTF